MYFKTYLRRGEIFAPGVAHTRLTLNIATTITTFRLPTVVDSVGLLQLFLREVVCLKQSQHAAAVG